MLLRESLPSQNSAFAKWVRRGTTATADLDGLDPTDREHKEPLRLNRKLSLVDLKQLCDLYEAGESMRNLVRKCECHRHTVMRHLQRAGVEIRPQRRMTPELVDRAGALYSGGRPLDEIGQLRGLEASTTGQALKRAGARLRPPVVVRRSVDK